MRSWESRRRNADAEWRMTREVAETVDCPSCGAVSGQHCTHPDGVPLGASPAHPARLTAAEQTNPHRHEETT